MQTLSNSSPISNFTTQALETIITQNYHNINRAYQYNNNLNSYNQQNHQNNARYMDSNHMVNHTNNSQLYIRNLPPIQQHTNQHSNSFQPLPPIQTIEETSTLQPLPVRDFSQQSTTTNFVPPQLNSNSSNHSTPTNYRNSIPASNISHEYQNSISNNSNASTQSSTNEIIDPKTYISENASFINIETELPGVSLQNIRITFKDSILTITAPKNTSYQLFNNETTQRCARSNGTYKRVLKIKLDLVDSSSFKYRFFDGILFIRIKKPISGPINLTE